MNRSTRSRSQTLSLALGAALAFPACSGQIAGDAPNGVAPAGDKPSAGGKPASGPTPSPAGPVTPPGPSTPTPASCNAGNAGPLPRRRLWRLSPVQYVNTVERLFGVKIPLASLPVDGVTDDPVTRFDTNADKNVVDDRLAGVYRDHAGGVAKTLTAGLGTTPHACALEATAPRACLDGFVRAYATKAFRRAVTDEELSRFIAFHEKARTTHGAPAAARMVLEAVLQSPHFLYRFELGTETAGPRTLTSAEIASQMSYLFTDGPPDDALTEAANKGTLTSRAEVQRQAERLLATPAARAKVRGFFERLLHVADLTTSKPKDPQKFPAFDDALRAALVNETGTFVERALFDEKGTLDTLFSAEHSYQSATVAKFYGGSGGGTSFERVALPRGRTGVLSHAAVIASLSNEATTSPVHRGLFFYQTLLCRPLPLPPANASNMVDKLSDPKNPEATQRELWAYFQTTSSGCAGCHGLFQPLGLGLERFDPIGRARDTEFSKTIDPSVVAAGLGDLDGSYPDALALGREVIASAEGRACFARQLATYMFGRAIDASAESCRLRAFADALGAANLSVQALLVAMTQDDSFYLRAAE